MTEEYRVPEFVELMIDGHLTLVPLGKAADESDLRGQLINRAVAELEEWCDRYAGLLEHLGEQDLYTMVDAIEQLKSRMGERWPKPEPFDAGQGI
jgi:hypothetical protein